LDSSSELGSTGSLRGCRYLTTPFVHVPFSSDFKKEVTVSKRRRIQLYYKDIPALIWRWLGHVDQWDSKELIRMATALLDEIGMGCEST
jgi:hypothetical protein